MSDCTPSPLVIDGRSLTVEQVVDVARAGRPVVLSDDNEVRGRIEATRQLNVDLLEQGVPVYGVNTGFGDSVKRQIDYERAKALQTHMVKFLGNGTGNFASREVARATMLIRANTLARGHSAVRPELIERLLEMLNLGIDPLIPEEGSVGASGDLVPLSYVAAAVVGSREVTYKGDVVSTSHALESVGLEPMVLEPKEGLALVNGTSFMSAIAVLALADSLRLAALSEACTALSVEVLRGMGSPFDSFLHDVAKPHQGQVASARNIRGFLAGSRLAQTYEEVVASQGPIPGAYRELEVAIQDKYSIRCAPHFIGVLRDTATWVWSWLTVEINSSNDNPLFDGRTGVVHSGGNFSGGHVGLAMDALKVAVASVGDLMDRQMELVVDEKFNNGLTPNLIARLPAGHPEEGLNHGFKAMQLACSSLTADALSRCMPVGIFSRSTECHNQDKVSMGSTSARQTRDVVELVEKVGVIHLLALCQAADLRDAQLLGATCDIYAAVRSEVPFVATDREMQSDISVTLSLLRSDLLPGDPFGLQRSQEPTYGQPLPDPIQTATGR